MKQLLHYPLALLELLFGRFRWTAPTWLNHLSAWSRSHSLTVIAFALTFFGAYAAYRFYQTLPKPVEILPVVEVPALTPNSASAVPDSLDVRFVYDTASRSAEQTAPSGAPSVARIDLVGEEVTQGVRLDPSVPGVWTWLNDNHLSFTPDQDWAPGVTHAVIFDEAPFSEQTRLANRKVTFTTHPFQIHVDKLEFFQDPVDAGVRRVTSTLNFTHPVDKASLQSALQLSMPPSASVSGASVENYQYSIDYDKNLREAYIQSQAMPLPESENYMRLHVDSGVGSLLGGEPTRTDVSEKLLIPDLYSFLKVASLDVQIVRNDNNDPEQVVLLEFTDQIDERALSQNLEFYLLPSRWHGRTNHYWQNAGEVDAEVLAGSQRLNVRQLPNPRSHSPSFGFAIDVDEGRQLFVRVAKGLTSTGGFIFNRVYDAVLTLPQYPREVVIAGEGSLLSNTGDKKLSVVSRGISQLKYSIGRLRDGEINHLISQTHGDISNPQFSNWRFDKENIAEFEERHVRVATRHPKDAGYSSLDLAAMLPAQGKQLGLFFVEVQAWDERNNAPVYGATDSRLILVTDLGLIVKNNGDGTHDVFVQSIEKGEPVARATVALLGKNGVPLYRETTNVDGHVKFPSTRDFFGEKQPVVYVVKTADDVSFIPYDRRSRQINLSRFDIGGAVTHHAGNKTLNAYGFTDRGIYRPGDDVKLAFIVKNHDLGNVENIPLELVINGPRNNRLYKETITLPSMGFLDHSFSTAPTSDTGEYVASLYVIRDKNRRGPQIGYTRFTVEEFQPDTMKISSEIQSVDNLAWISRDALTASVSLRNLFGVPAQDRRVEGRVVVEPIAFGFEKYSGYQFTPSRIHPEKPPLSVEETLASQTTDADGLAGFDIDLERFRDGTYQMRFTAEGFDQSGGRSVIARNTVLVSPLEYLVGYKADGKLDYINKDSKRAVEFIAIDNAMEKVSKQDLILRTLEVQQVSTLVRQHDGRYSYQSISKEIERSQEDFSIVAQGRRLTLDTTEAGDFALEVLDQQGRRLARADYSVVGFANLTGRLDKSAELQLKLSRDDYRPGDTIEMNIKAPYIGAGLITIETDRVHAFKWFNTRNQSSTQRIVLPSYLEGSAYVNVSFVRDITSEKIFVSPLSYAVQPFSIDRSKREIDVALDVPRLVRPGKAAEIGFTTSRKSRIAVFAVDEGILQVANYQQPRPLDHFLKKKALGVATLQTLDLILPEFSLVKSLSATGGDAALARMALAKNLNPFSRKTDAPAVYWSGVVNAGPSKKTLRFTVPDTFAGSLRWMAVAVSEEAFGSARGSTLVRGPFVLTPSVLTQAAPGDEFSTAVGITNIIEGSGEDAKITIRISTSDHLQIIGDTSRELTIDEGAEATVRFRLRAGENLGAANIIFNASHEETEAKRSVGLSIRPAMPYQSHFISGYDSDGDVTIDVPRVMYPSLAVQKVSASTSPLVMVDGLSEYLKHFPHGCTEQVVSKVFPLVGMMHHPGLAEHPRLADFFAEVVSMLRQRRQRSGGFSFWPGRIDVADYPTVYATHFLIEAQAQGFAVPQDLLRRALDYLRGYVGQRATTLDTARVRANAIYLLTRSGEITTNYLVDQHETLDNLYEKIWRKDLTASYMAATYQLLQKNDEAERLIHGYKINNGKKADFGDFHSPLTQDAQHVYLLAKHFPDLASGYGGQRLLTFVDPIFRGDYNTISAAYTILALGAMSELSSDAKVDHALTMLVTDNAGEANSLVVQREPFPNAVYNTGAKNISISADDALYYLNLQSGFDQHLPDKAHYRGLEIYRDFLDEDGNRISELRQGQTVTVRLRVRALSDRGVSNVAVVDLLPGGFEVIRSSVARTAYDWRADYVDVREDRVIYYGKFDNKTTDLIYKVKITAAGDFAVPPSFAYSMYDRNIEAISPGRRISVSSQSD